MHHDPIHRLPSEAAQPSPKTARSLRPGHPGLSRRGLGLALCTLAVGVGAVFSGAARASDEARVIPPYSGTALAAAPKDATSEVAVLAGGCFWGVQGVFQHVKGVSNAVSGYAGGDMAKPSYDAVSTGSTGHAEAVRISFDPKVVSYAQILQIYFSVAHDPTQLNRQGPDHGSQYRSAVFPTTPQQSAIAKAYIAQLDQAHTYPAPIVTKIEGDKPFYAAEAYHQDFLVRNPTYPYIVYNDLPKVEDLKRLFPAVYRPDPVLVMAGKKAG
jgi:peptide-methionine (S)-S-oxide reductase